MAANARGNEQRRRYFGGGEKSALDEAIAAYRLARTFGKDEDDDLRSVVANSLGSCLSERFKIAHDPDDLREGIAALEESNALTPEWSPYKKMVMTNLGLCAQQLYDATQEPRYIEAYVGSFARAAELATEPDEVLSYINRLGPAAHQAYRQTGKPEYLDICLDALERFLPVAQEPAKVLARMAEVLIDRYNKTSRSEDFDRAIDCQRRALAEQTIDADLRNGLRVDQAHFLIARAARTGSEADLQLGDQCLAALADVTALSATARSGLAAAWKQRFDISKQPAHLDRAIACAEAALDASPVGDEARVTRLAKLAVLLDWRYAISGPAAARDRIRQLAREVLALRRFETHASVDAVVQLGIVLQNQYTADGRLSDLELAIDCFEGLASAPQSQSAQHSAIMSNLGNALGDRYVRRGAREDLQRALACHHAAVQTADAANKGATLTNLGAVLSVCYDEIHELDYLNQSIDAYQRSIDATLAGSDLLPARLDNLGAALDRRFDVTRDRTDLDRAIELHQRALALLPDPCEVRVGVLNNLAVRLHKRYQSDRREADHTQVLETFRTAIKEGLEHSRGEALKAARNWVNQSFGLRNWAEVVEAYGWFETAATALLRIQAQRRDKEDWLRDLARVPSRAAVAFAHLGDLARAVVTLEQGCARLLAEALRTRRTGSLAPDASASDPKAQADAAFAQICRSAAATPLVYLCASEQGGLALIVDRDGTVRQLAIDALHPDELDRIMIGTDAAPGYLLAYEAWRGVAARPAALESWHAALKKTVLWQGERVFAELLPALSGIDEIVLIAVGTLALLPWHASPLAAPGPGATHVIDGLGIRYAPIAGALATDVPHQPSYVYFAAHNPQPANGAPLPLSELEVASCAQRFARAQIVSGAAATAEALIAGLDACDVFHFAGHAASDLRLPLNGGLEVAGPARLTLERLLAELHSGRLAVLSACETGVPGLRLPEEAISLSSGFLQVGFTGVIASLWPVSDFSAFFVMDRFYAAWPAQERDPGVALRGAQRWLRDASAAELAQQLERRERLLDNPEIAKLHRQLRAMQPEARPFSALFSWAAFSLWGV